MASITQTATRRTPCELSLVYRRCLPFIVLGLCALVLVHAVILEPYQIPTGSMAPTLRGKHRVCICPRCQEEVVIGRSVSDVEGDGDPRFYRKAFCANCGLFPVPVAEAAEVEGNRVLVNKGAFVLRSPTRWEIIVFRLLETLYIKRLLGLPGEEILIQDGDLHVNGVLARKSLDEAIKMRLLVFDQQRAPHLEGWRRRWDTSAGAPPRLASNAIALDGCESPEMVAYRNYSLEEGKSDALRDEYAYNAGLHPESEFVHDFMIESEIEIRAGKGSLALRLCDGADWVEVLLPIGERRNVEASCWPAVTPGAVTTLGESDRTLVMRPGERHAVTFAFVDRRMHLMLDGQVLLKKDLPQAPERNGVERPFQAQADGVQALLHGFRLYRDVHYGQQGRNGVHGKSVRLGVDQYFVLGDNSPNSQDSRFWPDQGRVPGRCLVGSACLVYGSSPMRWLP